MRAVFRSSVTAAASIFIVNSLLCFLLHHPHKRRKMLGRHAIQVKLKLCKGNVTLIDGAAEFWRVVFKMDFGGTALFVEVLLFSKASFWEF